MLFVNFEKVNRDNESCQQSFLSQQVCHFPHVDISFRKKPFHFNLTMDNLVIEVKVSLCGKPTYSFEVQSQLRPTI